MKKVVIIFAILIGTMALYAQEFNYPGPLCKDIPLLQQQLALAPDAVNKITITCQIRHLENPSKSFDEMKAMVYQVVNEVLGDTATEDDRIRNCKKFAYIQKIWIDELGAFCLANPSEYDVYTAWLGSFFKKTWAKRMMIDNLIQYDIPLRLINVYIEKLVDCNLTGEIDSAEMKDILQKMDIRYTTKLIADKEKWAVTVAKIRTLQERFQ